MLIPQISFLTDTVFLGRLGERELVFLIVRDLSNYRQVQLLQRMLPTCSVCGAVRDDVGAPDGQGAWMGLEAFLEKRSNASVSHTFCPECYEKYRTQQGLPKQS